MFLAFKEKRFAKRVIKRLLEAYSTVSARNPDLSDKALYREVLLHTQQVDLSCVDQMLQQAEGSIDQWTAHSQAKLNAVARRLNERPRKTLDYETLVERFNQCVASTG